MATENAVITDIDSALDSMIDPEMYGEEEKVEDGQEIDSEATTDEDDQDDHSEETEAESETDEESEEAEDDSDSEDDEEDSEESTAELHTVSVDGEEVQVDLNELKRGYSGQRYVQKGMQEVAQVKQQAEQVYQQLQSERQHLAQMAQMLESGQLAKCPQEPDKSTFESDPIGYMEARIQFDEDMEAYQQQSNALQGQLQHQSAAAKRATEVYLREQVMQLQAVDPDFSNPEKAQAIRSSMNKAGQEVYGYTLEEISGIQDHRAIRVLSDAARWQELQSTKGKTREKVTKNVAKRGKRKAGKTTTGESRRRKQRERLKSTGSIDDALSLMLKDG